MQDARKMKTLNNNNRKIPLLSNTYLATTAVATIFTLVMIFASTTTLVSASPTIGDNTTTTTVASPSSGIELSPQPVYQRTPSTSGVTPINQTHRHNILCKWHIDSSKHYRDYQYH